MTVIRWILLLTIVFFTGCPSTSAAELESFRFLAQQEVTVHPDSPFFVLEMDPSMSAAVDPSLRDLRIFAGDEELGYARIPISLVEDREHVQTLPILNQGVLEDGTYSFTLEIPRQVIGSLQVKMGGQPYLVKGTLYGSQDNRVWQKLRPITLFGIDGRFNEVSLEGLDFHYLKVEYRLLPGEVVQATEAALLTSVKEEATAATWETPQSEIAQVGKESILTVDLGYANRISSQWVVDTKDKVFSRMVNLEGSHDQTEWEPLGKTYIYRTPQEDEKLSFHYPPIPYRYLRMTVDNEDNAPLQIDGVKVMTHPVRLLVKAPSGTTAPITIAWGNSNLTAPSYDVGQFLEQLQINNFPVTVIKNYTENQDYVPLAKLAFTERYDYLMPVALVGASCFVGFLIYRSVKKMKG